MAKETFSYFLKGAYINFDAMELLGLSMNEYGFLESIHLWQKETDIGWAGPGLANNITTITLFKEKIGTRCGFSAMTTHRFVKKMKAQGLIEEKGSMIRVTPKFRVLKGDGKIDKIENDSPSVSREEKKHFYRDSPFMDMEYFKKFVIDAFPNERDIDIEDYFERIKYYYTVEKLVAYVDFGVYIKNTWIGRDIKDGKARRTATPSVTKEEIIKEIATYKKMADSITDVREYKKYRETIETLIFWTEKAQKANWLSEAQISRLEELKHDFNTGGALKKRLERQIKQAHTPTTTNDSLEGSVLDSLASLSKTMSMDG